MLRLPGVNVLARGEYGKGHEMRLGANCGDVELVEEESAALVAGGHDLLKVGSKIFFAIVLLSSWEQTLACF